MILVLLCCGELICHVLIDWVVDVWCSFVFVSSAICYVVIVMFACDREHAQVAAIGYVVAQHIFNMHALAIHGSSQIAIGLL